MSQSNDSGTGPELDAGQGWAEALARIERAVREGAEGVESVESAEDAGDAEDFEVADSRALSLAGLGLTELPPALWPLSGLQELDLSDNKLTVLPPEVGKLTNLRELVLNDNKLTALPPTLWQLKQLESLSVNRNQLTVLPPEVGQLTQLLWLSLNGNQLTALPPEVGQLARLGMLYLGENRLTALPPEVGQLRELRLLYLHRNNLTALPPEVGQLPELLTLYLGGNHVTTLPPEVKQLPLLGILNLSSNRLTEVPTEVWQLKRLHSLDLSDNRLTVLPPEVGQLTRLRELDVGGNQLTALPMEVWHLTQLEQLDLNNNHLTVLPPDIGGLTNLLRLDLSRNQLTMLPPEITQLTRLKALYLHGNPLPALPPELIADSHQAQTILHYYANWLRAPKRRLNEARLLLVGEGEVGKTSLADRMIDNTFDPTRSKTEGILIRRWAVPSDREDTSKELVQLNVWDFGGQEIMHATHQFFLSQRGLYLLVLGARAGEYESRLEYWLKLVHNFGADSPVIVVVNKIDQHQLTLDERGLRAKYPNIIGFARVSCKTGAGIAELRRQIAHKIGQLPHVRTDWLQTWFDIRKDIEDTQRDYMPLETYRDLCNKHGVAYASEQEQLLRFLHDLGVALNFSDERLQDTNVLNPEWVTRGVYAIINDEQVQAQHGVLRVRDLARIFDPQTYPPGKRVFILDMMRKFELCFRMDGDGDDERYLIPELLPKQQPSLHWDDTDVLRFQYHYGVLPGSVLSRFMVNMHAYIEDETYWRTGVVLAYQGGRNRALVRADLEDGKVFIAVAGNPATRRDFLSVIRAAFDRIHRSFARLDVSEMVPIPGHPNVLLDYQDLLALEEAGELSYFVPRIKQRVNVRELLDGVRGLSDEQRTQLYEQLVKLDIEDLKEICLRRGIDYENLESDNKRSLARSMIRHFEKLSRLHELQSELNRLRQ